MFDCEGLIVFGRMFILVFSFVLDDSVDRLNSLFEEVVGNVVERE